MKTIIKLLIIAPSFLLLNDWTAYAQHTKVPRIEDKSKTHVPLVDDTENDPNKSHADLKDLNDGKYKDQKDKHTYVPILTDADDLLDIEISTPKKTIKPNAAQQIYDEEFKIQSVHTFNKKFYYHSQHDGSNIQGHFFMNTHNGITMIDPPGMKLLADNNNVGKLHWLKDVYENQYYYTQSEQGNIAFKAGSNNDPMTHDYRSYFSMEDFFTNFKPSSELSEKGKAGHHFKARAFKGIQDGMPTTVWLAEVSNVIIDTRYAHHLNGFFSLGYIANKAGKTYLITAVQQGKNAIFLSKIESVKTQFDGTKYKPLGNMIGNVADARAAQKDAIQKALAEEEDPEKRRQMEIAIANMNKGFNSQMNNVETLKKDSDISSYQQNQNQVFYDMNYYETVSAQLQAELIDLNESLKGLIESGASKEEKNLVNCAIACNKIGQAKATEYRKKEAFIKEKYAKDPTKSGAAWQELLQKFTEEMANACACD